MNVFIGLFFILAFLAIGNLLSGLLGGFMPGSVIGMLLLFVSLLTGIVQDRWIRQVATFLTDNMMIFFMPAFMGIMDLWGVIKMNLWAWVAILILSTALVLVATGVVQGLIERISLRRKNNPETDKRRN